MYCLKICVFMGILLFVVNKLAYLEKLYEWNGYKKCSHDIRSHRFRASSPGFNLTVATSVFLTFFAELTFPFFAFQFVATKLTQYT